MSNQPVTFTHSSSMGNYLMQALRHGLQRQIAIVLKLLLAAAALLGFSDGSGERYQAYQQALSAAISAVGGHRLWVGRIDSQVIGSASPAFDQLVVTRYPHRNAYLAALSDPAVAAQSDSRREGLVLHWGYTATETELGSFMPTERTH